MKLVVWLSSHRWTADRAGSLNRASGSESSWIVASASDESAVGCLGRWSAS